MARMRQLCALTGSNYYVYGDPAYPLCRFILRGYKGACTAAQAQFSTEMSGVRESVEWGFGLIIRDWAFLDFRKNIKIGKQPIALLYTVGALLCVDHRPTSRHASPPRWPMASAMRLQRCSA